MIFLVWIGAPIAAINLYLRQVYPYFKPYGIKHLPTTPLLGNTAPVILKKQHLVEMIGELYSRNPKESFPDMILYIWLVAATAAIYFYCRQIYSRFSSYAVKHKATIPLLGNMGRVVLRRQHLVELFGELYSENPTERFVGRYEFTKAILIVKDLELLKKIAVKDFEYFLDHALSVSGDIDPLFGRTLFTLKGQEWKDMRSMLSPAFTSSKMKNMVPFIVEVGDQMMISLKRKLKESERNYVDIDCRDLATRYANDVIASCAFGLRVDSHSEPDNQFYKMGYVASNFTFTQMLKFFGHSAFPRLMKILDLAIFSEATRAFFNQLVMGTIRDREENGTLRPDMIHLLMEARKGRLTHDESLGKDEDAGFATVEESDFGNKSVNRVWTDTDLTAQAVIFFLAGFDTVSTAMTFVMYELALNPDVQDKLAQEIKEQDKITGGKFTYSSVQSMNYLDMVVSESLRRWPAAIATERLCTKDYNLGKPNDQATSDYIIKAGETLNIPITAFHHDPNFFPEPLKFDPERFSDENKHKIKPGSYMPFGIGPRNCIGSRFALCEIKVMIYQLLLHMKLSPCEKTPIPPKLCTDTFNLRLKGGHYIRMKLRN